MPLGPLANLHVCHLRFKHLFLLRLKTCATHVCSHDYSWPNSQRTHQALLRHKVLVFIIIRHQGATLHSEISILYFDFQTIKRRHQHIRFHLKNPFCHFFHNCDSAEKHFFPERSGSLDRADENGEVERDGTKTGNEDVPREAPIRWTPSPSVRPNWSESWTKSRRATSHKRKLWCSTRRANWTMDERTRNSKEEG